MTKPAEVARKPAPTKKNAAATRERILQAATKEFARHGIAGARVDRIAKDAKSNKNLIYVYFGSKEALFASVLGRHLRGLYDEVPVTPQDLPGYAVRLFDYALAHPDLTRLFAWSGLERRAPEPPEQTAGTAKKLRGIVRAQADGLVQREDTPAFLLSVLVAVAGAWTAANPFSVVIDPGSAKDPGVHREAIRRAAERLCSVSADQLGAQLDFGHFEGAHTPRGEPAKVTG